MKVSRKVAAAALPWLLVLAAVLLQGRDWRIRAASPDEWMTVAGITVDSAVTGIDPTIHVDRAIHQPFVADWVASVREPEATGNVVVCTGRGRSDYLVESRLPRPTRLSWWIGAPCDLTPGRYFLTTVWTIDLPGEIQKIIRRNSNVFTILPPPSPDRAEPRPAEPG